jgi:hypothetical protein
MSNRDALLALKASRKGFKGLTTRSKRVALDSIATYVEGEDPFYVENKLQTWERNLQKYREAEGYNSMSFCGRRQ